MNKMRNIADVTPHQYVIDMGWDWACIEDTARLGASAEDAGILGTAAADRLAEYCRNRVAEAARKNAQPEPGQYRVRETDDGWRVEGRDNNGVWVSCGLYDTREEAEDSISE